MNYILSDVSYFNTKIQTNIYLGNIIMFFLTLGQKYFFSIVAMAEEFLRTSVQGLQGQIIQKETEMATIQQRLDGGHGRYEIRIICCD